MSGHTPKNRQKVSVYSDDETKSLGSESHSSIDIELEDDLSESQHSEINTPHQRKLSSSHHSVSSSYFSSPTNTDSTAHQSHHHKTHQPSPVNISSPQQSTADYYRTTANLLHQNHHTMNQSMNSSFQWPENNQSLVGSPTQVSTMDLAPAISSPQRVSSPMVSNSKAVIAALKALQQKIKKLEDERNFYRSNYESQKTSLESSQRAFSDEKMNLMKEKETILMDRNTMSSTLTRVQEKLSTAEHERSYYASLTENLTKEKKELEIKLESQETLIKQQKLRIEQLETNVIQEREASKETDEKMDGLQRQFVRERRKRERAETDKQKIDKALKELLSIHSDLVATATNSATIKKKKKRRSSTTKTRSRPSSARTTSRTIRSKSRTKIRTLLSTGDKPFLGGMTRAEESFNIIARSSAAQKQSN